MNTSNIKNAGGFTFSAAALSLALCLPMTAKADHYNVGTVAILAGAAKIIVKCAPGTVPAIQACAQNCIPKTAPTASNRSTLLSDTKACLTTCYPSGTRTSPCEAQ